MSEILTEPNDQEKVTLKNSQKNRTEVYSNQTGISQDTINEEHRNQTNIDQESITDNSNSTVSSRENCDQEKLITDQINNTNMNNPNITGNEGRRKRINRIKTVIVITLLLLFLFPTICCIVLGIQVNRLQKQINEMNDPSRYGMLHETTAGMNKSYAEGTSASEINQNAEGLVDQIPSPVDNPESGATGMMEDEAGKNGIPEQSVNSEENGVEGAFITASPDHSNLSDDLSELDLVTSKTDETDSGEDNYIINDFNNNSNMKEDNSGGTGLITGQPEAFSEVNSNNSSDNDNRNGNIIENIINNEPGIVNNNDVLNPAADNASINSNKDTSAEANTGTHGKESKSPDAPEADDEKEAADTSDKTGKFAGKTVYLTFDDGPSIYTGEILDILAKYNIKATFFVVGKTDDESIEMYQRIVKEGHTLGMHSYSHEYDYVYNSVEDFDKDFTKLWNLLYDTTGYKPSIYRFPGGSNNKVNKYGMEDFIRYLNTAGIVYFDWNVVSGDATGIKYSKEQLVGNVLSGVTAKKTSIVLMHDSRSKKTTVESLPGLLDKLISEGATILPLDINVTPIQMIKADSIK